MTGHPVTIAIGVGAALLAMWTHVRFPRLHPDSFRVACLHMGISVLVTGALVGPGMDAAGAAGGAAGIMLGVFCVALPALVYCMLAALWMLRAAMGLMPIR